jgi:ATP-binding cassette subfamily B protein
MLAGANPEPQLNANFYVGFLRKAVAAIDPRDLAARRDVYLRARNLLVSRLADANILNRPALENQIGAFYDAVAQIEGEDFVRACFHPPSAAAPRIANVAPAPEWQAAPRQRPDAPLLDVALRPPHVKKKRSAAPAPRRPSRRWFFGIWPFRTRARSKIDKPQPKPAGRPPEMTAASTTIGEVVASSVAAGIKARSAQWQQKMFGSVAATRDGVNVALASAMALTSRAKQALASATLSGAADGSSVGADQVTSPAAQLEGAVQARFQAVMQVARYHGVELELAEFKLATGEQLPSAASLSVWAQNAGLWSKAVRIQWRELLKLGSDAPVALLFADGTAAVLTGVDTEKEIVLLRDPAASADGAGEPVDELRLSQFWRGEAVLLRANRGRVSADAPFSLGWLLDLVLQERRLLRDIAIASTVISLLTIFPPMLVMATVNKVLQFHSVSTLILLSTVLAVVVGYEALLGHARRLITAVVGARLDAKLNLHVFNRLLRLPLDYFERNPAGETMYKIAQVYRVREFLTGRLLSTLLDLITLCVLMPFLFYLSPILASFVLFCAGVIILIILGFLKPMREHYARLTAAETMKAATLGETVFGIKTVKALALEPQRRALWDERIAEAGKWRLAFAQLSNWPQTLVMPMERLMVLGATLLGAYMAMNDSSGYMVGSLFAFFMLSGRIAQPLVGMARLIEEFEEIGAAIGEAASVLNRPMESSARSSGLRPKLAGEIQFQDVTFTYPSNSVPALERVSFQVPAGTTVGLVGRSGSGKSTITRLLQGINRDYKGFVKMDGVDLRDVDLRHLRQSLGVVLQDNFLFRGSIRENIIAGRPGLTLAHAVQAARLAGAEEFIERMPNGFETYIEEGSPNLSGGQRQRLAIARALITDPRILILDEATSALDPESEAVVNANLQRIGAGRTMVIVSHRMSSLVNCDQILVLDQGKIQDCGPHSVLVERCAIYRQLWNQQNRHGEPTRPAAAPRLVTGRSVEP